MPIPRGGGAQLAEALVSYIRAQGGTCETGVHVERVSSGGVRTADGREADRGSSGDLQRHADPALHGAARRSGRQGGEVPLRPVGDADPLRSRRAAEVGGRRPARADGDRPSDTRSSTASRYGRSTRPNGACCRRRRRSSSGQPLTMDESRAPKGKGLLWIQLQELPWRIKGDAAGELDVGDGSWTDELRERYADRIEARLARHIPNLESSILGRTCLSPADLQAANVNLVRGDPYGGSLALDQNFLWRAQHRTPVRERVAHRRVDPSRAGPRRRVGRARGGSAARGAVREAGRGPLQALSRPPAAGARMPSESQAGSRRRTRSRCCRAARSAAARRAS